MACACCLRVLALLMIAPVASLAFQGAPAATASLCAQRRGGLAMCMSAGKDGPPRHARRSLWPMLLAPHLAALTAAAGGAAAANSDDDAAKAARLAQAMAVVGFTKTIDQATDRALKLADKGDLKGAEKQWNIVVDTYESGDDGVVVSTQAVYRLGKTLGLRADVRSQLGQKNKDNKKLTQAIEDYQKSLTIVDSAEIRIKLATVLLLVGRGQESEKEFDSVIEGDSGNQVKARAYNNRGLVKQQQGQWSEAVDDFKEAVQISQGGSPEAMKNLALAKFEAGDEKGALTMLQEQSKAMIFGPVEGAEDIPAALAAAEAAMGNADQAAADLKKVKDNRFKDVRFVAEGRLWPPKLVAGLQSLVGPSPSPK